MSCYNDFANTYADQIIRIAPRTEPLETRINDPEKIKHESDYVYSDGTRHTWTETKITKLDTSSNVGQYRTMETKTETYKRQNRFTGESIQLTAEEADKHDEIFLREMLATAEDKQKGYGASKHWEKMRELLDWFRKNNAKAYMVLLD